MFRTNVFGAFLCSREAAKRLSTKSGGRGGGIVTLSSAHAVNTGVAGNWVHFAASKAALETMSRGLAKELAADGIRSISCGPVSSPPKRVSASPKTT